MLLVGLVLNATFGLSWADLIAALIIATVAVKEGRDAWHGKHLTSSGQARRGHLGGRPRRLTALAREHPDHVVRADGPGIHGLAPSWQGRSQVRGYQSARRAV